MGFQTRVWSNGAGGQQFVGIGSSGKGKAFGGAFAAGMTRVGGEGLGMLEGGSEGRTNRMNTLSARNPRPVRDS